MLQHESNAASAAPCYFSSPLQLGCFQRRRLCSFLNVASKQRMAVLLLFSVFIVFMASDFPSAVDISFLCDMAHKIICISEKALPEDKSKIKFIFPSTIVLVKNKKYHGINRICLCSVSENVYSVYSDINLLMHILKSTNCCHTAEVRVL